MSLPRYVSFASFEMLHVRMPQNYLTSLLIHCDHYIGQDSTSLTWKLLTSSHYLGGKSLKGNFRMCMQFSIAMPLLPTQHFRTLDHPHRPEEQKHLNSPPQAPNVSGNIPQIRLPIIAGSDLPVDNVYHFCLLHFPLLSPVRAPLESCRERLVWEVEGRREREPLFSDGSCCKYGPARQLMCQILCVMRICPRIWGNFFKSTHTGFHRHLRLWVQLLSGSTLSDSLH